MSFSAVFSEIAKGVVDALITAGEVSEERRAAAERAALEHLRQRPDPDTLGEAYARAKAEKQ